MCVCYVCDTCLAVFWSWILIWCVCVCMGVYVCAPISPSSFCFLSCSATFCSSLTFGRVLLIPQYIYYLILPKVGWLIPIGVRFWLLPTTPTCRICHEISPLAWRGADYTFRRSRWNTSSAPIYLWFVSVWGPTFWDLLVFISEIAASSE